MNILVLGPYKENLYNYLIGVGERVEFVQNNIHESPEILGHIDFLISYGYRHIIGEEIINRYRYKAINLHISYLPWNRGADPNLWSHLEDTKKGVTIHNIDKGLDTGDILIQKEVEFSEELTLKETYEILTAEIENLFMENWLKIKKGNLKPVKQIGKGTYHRVKDKERFVHLLTYGWDTKTSEIKGKANIETMKGG